MSQSESVLQLRLRTYGESHQNARNILIHKFCVPAIVLSIIGLLSTIPFPFADEPGLHWGGILAVGMLIYYFLLSPAYALIMCLYVGACLGIVHGVLLNLSPGASLSLWVGVFVIAWIGQFIGHKIEGKKPSFLDDIRYLLIGPLWVFHAIKTKKTGV